MELGQLIEYDMRNTLFEKSYTKLDPFLKKQNWAYLDQ